MKVIVKSKSFAFDGLYFRAAKPNSIEWTSFDMAAWVFINDDEAVELMRKCGIDNYEIELAPFVPERKLFSPSPSTGFKS